MALTVRHVFVPSLPDLVGPEGCADDPDGRGVRIRIETTATGVRVLADSLRPTAAEDLLMAITNGPLEQPLCG